MLVQKTITYKKLAWMTGYSLSKMGEMDNATHQEKGRKLGKGAGRETQKS